MAAGLTERIHTGLQHGVIRHAQPNCLPMDEVTLPQKLKENGYTTNMVGKWHIGFYLDACTPTERGFDSFFDVIMVLWSRELCLVYLLRASLCYWIHTGLQHGVIRHAQPNCLPVDEVTLPQKLKENGYTTNMVGKWHIGFYLDACTPTERGFDSFFGFLIGAEDHYTRMLSCEAYNANDGSTKTLSGHDLHANKTPVFDYEGQYSTHLFTNKTVDVIERHDKTKPLFIYLAYQAVHAPLQVPDSYMDPYKNIADKTRRTYAGMVSCMDEGIGNVTQALKDAGLYDNTIIIFSTDNGGHIDRGGNNWPLRGSKGSMWEGGIHGVGFVHSPLLPDAVKGTVNHELMHVSDWLPTIVAGIAGGALNGTKPLDGYNVWSSIRYHSHQALFFPL
eukprot:XP_011660472.1 PREDICTED: arylsulfatase J [Strongylocentrotus purpuratus]